MEPLIDEKGTVLKPKRSRVRCCSTIDWWQEIGSFLFSVLCLLGMVVLLSRIQNRPLTSWSFVVSPNALISVLSTASKACLILPVSECISQLKWMYLVESKRDNRLTNLQDFDNASRGPLGSFRFFFHTPTRAWLPYLGCAITLVAVATDAFAQQILGFETEFVLASEVYSELRTAQDVYEWDGDAMFQMKKSVKLALYGEPQLPDLHCPGSICDYPSFASIGATSKCQDVTTRSSGDCIMGEPQQDFQEQWCNFTSPGGFQLQSNQMHIYDSTLRGMQGTSSTTKNSIYTEVPYPDVLLDFGVLQYPYDFIEPTGSVQIHECTLKMSAVEYVGWYSTSESVHPGLLNTYSMVNTTPWEDMKYGNETMGFAVSDPAFPFPRSYSISVSSLQSLMQTLNFSLVVSDSDVFRSPSVPETLANVSAAITHRMLNGPNSTVTRVPVSNYEVLIIVRWVWISLPAALVLAAGLLLLAVMYRTRRAQQRVWKSSLTPLLLAHESYPAPSLGQKPHGTPRYLKARTAAIVNHLTK